MTIIETILVIYSPIAAIGSLVGIIYWFSKDCDCNILGQTPIGIHKNCDVNWLGSLLLFLFAVVICPFLYIGLMVLYTIIIIFTTIYMLCTFKIKK